MLFLPGSSGAGGIINWGGRVQKKFFCQGVVVQEALSVEGAGCKTIFQIWHFFLILNLKILPIWFSQVSRCHLKDFYSRILKQGLLFAICDFSIFKIWSEVVNLWVGHPVYSEKATKFCEIFTLHLTTVHRYSQKKGEDFAKFCGLLRRYEIYDGQEGLWPIFLVKRMVISFSEGVQNKLLNQNKQTLTSTVQYSPRV